MSEPQQKQIIPNDFRIYETDDWLFNHRVNSALSGYLVLGTKTDAVDVSGIPMKALASLGPLINLTHNAMQSVLNPAHICIGRYGHNEGLAFHLHLIPVYKWVEELFWEDNRYRVFGDFATPQGATGTDGIGKNLDLL
ncbi:MAG: HIT family protein [Pseudomonadota bacterium]